MNIIFTILIPHKNRPQLLERAIHSVPKRNDVQIIVVDDNSDPGIVDFDHFPCIDEPNVEVYLTKEGKGAGYARNVGLPHVKGKWLTIIGSDDYFTDEMPALMDKVADRDEDVIFFKCTAVKEPSMTPSTRGENNNEEIDNALKTNDYSELMLLSHDALKFYRMDFIRKHNIRFHEVRWGNDVWFTACVAKYAQSFIAFTDKAYCITESDNSLVSATSLESALCRLEEESAATQLLRHKYKNKSLIFWLVKRWEDVWHKSKAEGIKTAPKVAFRGGVERTPPLRKVYSASNQKKSAKNGEEVTTLFTILIPHKNRPQLLERAIHSVPKRDDVQIIVVDDNSDPEIVDFDHFPCIDEPNVEVYLTKEGKGAGYARNVGLPHVKGKWLTIIGSDDYFTDEMPALMDKVADRDEDVIFFNATAICEPSLRPSNRCDYINERVENTLKTGDYTELLLTSNDAVKFFRMDFIRKHNIRFHEVRWGNDAWFCDCVAYYAQTYHAFPDKAYCITESDGSLLMTASLESYLCRMNEALQGIKLIRKKFQTETIYFYLMAGWKRIWKFSKWEALKLMPKVLYCGGGRMIPYFKTFFSHLIKNKFKNI